MILKDVETFLRSDQADTAEVLSLVAKVALEEFDLTTEEGCAGAMQEMMIVWSALSNEAIRMMNTFALINQEAYQAIDADREIVDPDEDAGGCRT